MPTSLHVVGCCDDNFLRHLAATFTSVLAVHPQHEVHCHLLAQHITPAHLEALRQHLEERGARFHFHAVQDEHCAQLHVCSDAQRLSLATYYRIFIPQLLSEEIDRVLYLDADTIVRRDLTDFYYTDLEGYSVAAVKDVQPADLTQQYCKRLGYDSRWSYFNAGVLLINLKHWRAENIAQNCLDFFHQHPERIVLDDQDVLNAVLAGTVKYMPLRYNAIAGLYHLSYSKKVRRLTFEELQMLKEAAILHFTGSADKPWNYRCLHPYRHEYFRHLAKTPWARTSVKRQWKWCVKHYLRKWSIDIGLGRRQFYRFKN